MHTAHPGGVAYSGRAEDSVAAFLPITLHGQLDTDELITMLNAHNHGGSGQWFRGYPRYVAHTAVLGANVDADQPIHAIRFRLGNRYWFDHLRNGDRAVTAHDAVLDIGTSEDGNWLTYHQQPPKHCDALKFSLCRVRER